MFILALISIVTLLAGFLIVAIKQFYPHHFKIGMLLMLVSTGLFVYSAGSYFNKLQSLEALNTAEAFLLEHQNYVYLFLAVMLMMIAILLALPLTKNPFKGLSAKELHARVLSDMETANLILDHLELTGNELVNSELLQKQNFNADEREELKEKWNRFVIAALESDIMTDTYQFFYLIPVLSQAENHAKAFSIAYALFLEKNMLISRVINLAQSNETAKKILNEKVPEAKIRNAYKKMAENYFHPKTIFAINAGQGYLKTVIHRLHDENDADGNFTTLKEQAHHDFQRLKKELGANVINSARVGSERIEKKIFSLWFPVQRKAAQTIGHAYISTRKEKLISIRQIQEMNKKMEPGDIMLQRRNWHASNIGIPGFWAHAALFTGTPEEMDEYFKSEFPLDGHNKMSDYLEVKFPEVYRKFREPMEGYKMAVIEGREPGIILQPLEVSAYADYVVVLRPRLSKGDKLRALLRAFSNYGKLYDFDFDFENKDAMVCSELVYDAYQERKGKKGLHFSLSEMNGRKMMAPVDIAKKFQAAFGSAEAELDFIYFLDGDEATGKATPKDVRAFLKTLDRPKYSLWRNLGG